MHISPVLWQFLVKWLTNPALFSPEAPAISPYMDAFYFFLLAISAVGLIAVAILVFGFSIMYRKEKNPVATHIEGSTLIEATWTIIPLDVFHSFSIPAFRVKREVIPGRYSTVWFEATATGTYHLFCTQYCGTDHSAMIGDIVAMTPEDYQKWASGSTSGASLAQNGERLFASLGCASCHFGAGGAPGPN